MSCVCERCELLRRAAAALAAAANGHSCPDCHREDPEENLAGAYNCVALLCGFLERHPDLPVPEAERDWDNEQVRERLARMWARRLLGAARVDWHSGHCPLCCS